MISWLKSIPMKVEAKKFKHTLGAFPTGVTVVTLRSDDGSHIGITISSFTSLSMDPPQALFCLSKGSRNLSLFQPKRHFIVNVLSDNQEYLADSFAKGMPTDWDEIATPYDEFGGCMRINHALAHITCTVKTVVNSGDHHIVIGEINDLHRNESESSPLIRFSSEYRKLMGV